MTQKKRDTPSAKAARPYRTPKLTIHGDLLKIVNAKGGTKNDGGGSKPRTRESGGQS